MFVASAGAAIQNLMVALSAQAVGSCWVSSSLFAPEAARRAAGLDEGWEAVGCVAAGYPAEHPSQRAPIDPSDSLDIR
jgi:dehydro coenzyme F420 reductase / coenzyme F420-0:L-glutamate ligase / coenzyme F420-1:gamma-L-glutamate ligase